MGEKEPEQMRKIFVGSLIQKTNDDDLREFYSQFGEITDCIVMKDKSTGKSRGFGFVTYSAAFMVDEAMKNRPHTINGRASMPKRAMPREETQNAGSQMPIQKIFIGGLRDHPIAKEDLDEYFGEYGKIKDSVIMVEKATGKPRGFAFVEFDDYDPVDKIILQKEHKVKGAKLEVKKAMPRDADAGPMRGGRGGPGGRGGMGGGRGGMGGGFGAGGGGFGGGMGGGGFGGGMDGGFGGGYGGGMGGGFGGGMGGGYGGMGGGGGGGGYGGMGGYGGGFGGGMNGGMGGGRMGGGGGGYGGGSGFGSNYGQNQGGGPMRGGFGGGGGGRMGPYGGRM